jgi:hypothetical protein
MICSFPIVTQSEIRFTYYPWSKTYSILERRSAIIDTPKIIRAWFQLGVSRPELVISVPPFGFGVTRTYVRRISCQGAELLCYVGIEIIAILRLLSAATTDESPPCCIAQWREPWKWKDKKGPCSTIMFGDFQGWISWYLSDVELFLETAFGTVI